VLGLIPARGGSVRLPRKNLAHLGDKSLLAWAIKSAIGAVDDLVVSTDDAAIAKEAVSYGIPYIDRPKELAEADTPMLPVVRHAVSLYPTDVVVLLQPTSPFRTNKDVKEALKLFRYCEADAVISVTQAPDDLVFEIGHAGRMRLAENTVVPNGAIYIISSAALARGHDWYSGVTYAYKMPRDRSLDIDTPVDLAMARAVVEKMSEAA
jgi:N-acylneuraminate cytidylyltransferase